MSIKIIPCRRDSKVFEYWPDAEQELADVLEPGTWYGFDVMEPGDFGSAISAASMGQCAGITGMFIPETAVNLRELLRVRVGRLLQSLGQADAPDDLSCEWLLHFGASRGTFAPHPLLLCRHKPAGFVVREPLDIIRAISAVLDNHDSDFEFEPSSRVGGLIKYGVASPEHVTVRYARQLDLDIKDGRLRIPFSHAQDIVVAAARFYEQRSIANGRVPSEKVATVTNVKKYGVRAELERLYGVNLISDNTQADRNHEEAEDDMPRHCAIGSVFDPATHYTAHYYDGRGLTYETPDGTVERFAGCGRSWDGMTKVVSYLDFVFDGAAGERVLDIGCGAGGFVGPARDAKWDAFGADISLSAINQAAPELRPYLLHQDITAREFGVDKPFALTTAWDFWEHIYHSDLDKLMAGVANITRPGGFHACVICTRGDGEQDWTIKPGTKFDHENSWLLVSGHVLIRNWWWWTLRFEQHGFRLRGDMSYQFQVRMAEDAAMRTAASWSPRNFFILQKVG